MGDLIGKARTNVFTVRAGKYDDLVTWAGRLGLIVQLRRSFAPQEVVLLCDDTWPNYDPADDELTPITFAAQIVPFAAPDQVVILVEAVHEGLRYVGGSSQAVHTTTGEQLTLDLVHDIMDMCKSKWPGKEVPKPHEP